MIKELLKNWCLNLSVVVGWISSMMVLGILAKGYLDPSHRVLIDMNRYNEIHFEFWFFLILFIFHIIGVAILSKKLRWPNARRHLS